MAEYSGISWTDHTHNEWFGCTAVSPGCDHCYAEAMMDKRLHKVKWGAGEPRQRTVLSNRQKPHSWNKEQFAECQACGWRGELRRANIVEADQARYCPACQKQTLQKARARVFAFSLGDWLDNEVPIWWLIDFLETVRCTPALDWLLLTKRIGTWRKRLSEVASATVGKGAFNLWLTQWLFTGYPPPNVWIGATMVDQLEVDRDFGKLTAVPARVHFVSIEPILGPIDLRLGDDFGRRGAGVHWIIPGAESGPQARPAHVDWIRSLVQQGKEAGVAVHVKQLGKLLHESGMTCPGEHWPEGITRIPLGRRAQTDPPYAVQFKHEKGGDPTEWPEDLRVREFPR